jgi:hypothetical protein
VVGGSWSRWYLRRAGERLSLTYPMFADDLKAKGWTEITQQWEYAKGDWKIDFDTGHWMIVSTARSPGRR